MRIRGPEKRRRRGTLLITIRRDRYLYVLLAVPLAFYVLFRYVPMYGVTIAFKDYNIFRGVLGSDWVGLEVFREIFGMQDFGRALRNTLVLNLLDLAFGFPAPIALAIMFSELRVQWYKKVSQTLCYLPHFISWMIVGGITYQMFSLQSGIVNHIIVALGAPKPVPFLMNPSWWLLVYIGTGVWHGMGWGAILYLAAIAGISPELYEAATVDGCGRLRRIWHITLPGMRPTIAILLILNLGRVMDIGFERPYALGNVLVSQFSEVISTFVYRVGILSGRFSIATAVGLFQSAVGLVLILAANRLSRRIGEQGIW